MTIAYGVTFTGIGVSIPAEIVVAESFGAGSSGYAAMFTLWAVGGLVGASAGNRFKSGMRKVRVLVVSSVAIGAGFAAVSAAPHFAIILLGMAFGGIGEGLWEVTQISLIQRVASDGIRGRVFAASTAAMQGSIAIGLLVSGAITAIAGASGAFAVAGAVAAAATLILIVQGLPAEHRSRPGRRIVPAEPARPPSRKPPVEVARTV